MPTTEPGPSNMVYQPVTLKAGARYVLSWWDIARGPAGEQFDTMVHEAFPYEAAVLSQDWEFVALESWSPSTGDVDDFDGGWSERRSIEFEAFEDGVYYVGFRLPAELEASIAIANVQLELAPAGALAAGPYFSNSASRATLSGDCSSDSTEAFRARFVHRCIGSECFFEMGQPLVIDTELLSQGFSSLVGKVGADNYNYRHAGLAVNVVGTGVLDCSQVENESCYGSAYVEYELRHSAPNVPLLDYDSHVTCFDFGTGAIRSGKALASERFLTLPLGSADLGLISQEAFLKPELVGRPLSGTYRLRIRDNPALVWSKVEDIQIVLNYRYWSRVLRTE